MSEYAVHFTKASGGVPAITVLLQILGAGRIQSSGPFGAAKGLVALGATQRSACFSEIPLDLLDRLVARRSSYGLGLAKAVLSQADGARVWYLDKETGLGQLMFSLVQNTAASKDWASALWRLTPYIDYVGDFGGQPHEFEWEREWRVSGDFEFEPSQVLFAFLPAAEHELFRQWDAANGARYDSCVLVDAAWPDDQIQAALVTLPA